MISVIIIEAETRERERMRTLLAGQRDLRVLGTGKDEYDALRLVTEYRPDVAIIEMESFGGVSRMIKLRSNGTALALLGSRADLGLIGRAVDHDADAYLLKGDDFKDLPAIVRQVNAGEPYVSPRIATRAFKALGDLLRQGGRRSEWELSPSGETPRALESMTLPPALSGTERRVIAYVARGWSGPAIADSLGIAQGTVRNCVSSMMRKARLKNRVQLAMYASRWGMTEDPGA